MKKNKPKKTYTKDEIIKANIIAIRVACILIGISIILAGYCSTYGLNWLELLAGLICMSAEICFDKTTITISDAEVKRMNEKAQKTLWERLKER